jgi:hypothetical protein
VLRVTDADPDRRALLRRRRHLGRQLEAEEARRRGLFFSRPLQVFVGDRNDACEFAPKQTCSIRRWIDARVKFLSRVFTALNLLPSMATIA